MPEKTKPQKNDERQNKEVAKKSKVDDALSKYQREKSYYYDDAYGYEVYNPEDDKDEEEN